MPRHGIGQQVQRSSAGSIPHDRITILQICSSRSLPLDRPRQSASRHPPVVTNRPTTYRVRRDPRLIQQPFHHPPACWSASTPFTHLIRGTQIPIAQAATPTSPSRGFLPWRFAYAGPRCSAAPPSWGRHPQTFTQAAGPERSFLFASIAGKNFEVSYEVKKTGRSARTVKRRSRRSASHQQKFRGLVRARPAAGSGRTCL